MTTIAWDGKILAADRKANWEGLPLVVRKLHDCGDHFYGGCGAQEDNIRIAEWIRGGRRREDLPDLDEGGGWGIAVERATGLAFHVVGKKLSFIPIAEMCHADGSGRDFAIASMDLVGFSAIQAVQYATRFNISTGLGVDWIRTDGDDAFKVRTIEP